MSLDFYPLPPPPPPFFMILTQMGIFFTSLSIFLYGLDSISRRYSRMQKTSRSNKFECLNHCKIVVIPYLKYFSLSIRGPDQLVKRKKSQGLKSCVTVPFESHNNLPRCCNFCLLYCPLDFSGSHDTLDVPWFSVWKGIKHPNK